MPQVDLTIENKAFPDVRQELNATILALLTDNSGATAPPVTQPYMKWADTANMQLKVRSPDNLSWVTVARLNQAFFGILPADIGALTASLNFSDIGNRETAKANLGISSGTRNRIINGDFRVNQRGSSSYNFANNVYTLDRWVQTLSADGGTLASGNITRQNFTAGATVVDGEPESFLRITNTTQGTSLGVNSFHSIGQAIEDVRLLSGQRVTISFWAQTTITGKTLGVELLQNFGAGGSAITNVGGQTFALSGTWQRFSFSLNVPSLSGKTLGTSHHTFLNFFAQAGSGFTSRFGTFGWQGVGDINVANVQVEVSPFVTAFERRTIADELALCQRYYEEVQIILGATTPGATGYFHQIYFKQNKRVAPTSAVKTLNSSSNFTIDSFTAFVPTCVLSCTIPASGAYSANALISFNAEM